MKYYTVCSEFGSLSQVFSNNEAACECCIWHNEHRSVQDIEMGILCHTEEHEIPDLLDTFTPPMSEEEWKKQREEDPEYQEYLARKRQKEYEDSYYEET